MPPAIYVLIISLIGLILLSIFNKKLKKSILTMSEYGICITTIIGIFLMFFECC